MEPKPLPVRPSLEQYKKQAKELLKAYRSADVETIRRVKRNHPRFEKLAEPGFEISKFSLADAQLMIAREHGFESWPKFTKRIEVMNSEIAALANPMAAFIEAAIWHGTLEAAEAILAAHPEIARESIHVAAILGDDAAVRRFIAADSRNVTKTEAPYDGDALVYLCLSKYLRLDKARSAGFLRAATALLDAGADPNVGFWSKDEHREFETALYGAAGVAHHAELTRLLLARGADPNEEETPYHSPEGYDNGAVRVLVESGKLSADSLTTMLLRKADMHDYDGMKYLLEDGADPNRMTRWHYTALQQAIRRDNRIELIDLMLDHGADPTLKNEADGTSGIAMAARRGRSDVLGTFARRGFPMPMPHDGMEHLIVSVCTARGGMAGTRAFRQQFQHLASAASLTEFSELRAFSELLTEGSTLLAEFAGNGNTKGVQQLLDIGVPVDTLYDGDPYFDIVKNSTALHVAAWKAWPKTVKLLIERGANVNAQDAKGRTPLMLAVKACVDSYWTNRRSPESVEALLKAGASVEGVDYPSGYVEVDALLQSYGKLRNEN
ncbi:MAG TPA: ankyrin repeat domain-containing protein [Candidatus Angelobacter sp.]|jgi:ankyrin repeat protein|nr:ankyrin repeat domain-containing protein [Candidatus Angelobacter sp.]